MQLLPNQSMLFSSGGWVWKPNEKRIENTANFLNLHFDKATKTCGDKQLYLGLVYMEGGWECPG